MEKANYGEIAPTYDDARSLSASNMSLWLGLISSLVGQKGAKTLDLGCGTGRFAIPFATQLGYSVTAVDSSPEMIAKAREKLGADQIAWVIQDVTTLGNQLADFDFVFTSHLLHHLDQPRAMIDRCLRFLKPGGIFVNRYGAMDCIEGDPEHTFFPSVTALDAARTPTVRQVEEWVSNAGFVDVGSNSVVQQTDMTAAERVRRVGTRVSSVLTLISDDQFQDGLARLKDYAAAHPHDRWLLEDKLTLTWGRKPA